MADELRKRGLPPLPTRANFISFNLKRNSIPVMAAMAERGVLAREWRDPGFETYMRISIGLPRENDLALRALDESLSAA
jgi:histidinol-phosphate aminotransferase